MQQRALMWAGPLRLADDHRQPAAALPRCRARDSLSDLRGAFRRRLDLQDEIVFAAADGPEIQHVHPPTGGGAQAVIVEQREHHASSAGRVLTDERRLLTRAEPAHTRATTPDRPHPVATLG